MGYHVADAFGTTEIEYFDGSILIPWQMRVESDERDDDYLDNSNNRNSFFHIPEMISAWFGCSATLFTPPFASNDLEYVGLLRSHIFTVPSSLPLYKYRPFL